MELSSVHRHLLRLLRESPDMTLGPIASSFALSYGGNSRERKEAVRQRLISLEIDGYLESSPTPRRWRLTAKGRAAIS